MNQSVGQNAIHKTIGRIAVVSVFLDGVLIVGIHPQGKTPDVTVHLKIASHQGGTDTGRLKFFRNRPKADRRGKPLGLEKKDPRHGIVAFHRHT